MKASAPSHWVFATALVLIFTAHAFAAIPTVVTQLGEEKLYLNKPWISAAKAEYHFNRDGSGFRLYTKIKTSFTWRKLDTGIVEVAGRMVPAGPQVMWFFKFDNKKTALFGTSEDKIMDPLRAER
jgi:hypothetical protein